MSDHSTPERDDVDEFEALRLARLQTQRSVCAPERDISEDDAETAEFQTRLRRLSSTRSTSAQSVSPRISPLKSCSFDEDDQKNAKSESEEVNEVIAEAAAAEEETQEEDINDDINDDFLSRLRPERRFEKRDSEAPEREIETEDKESAELQTNLRRSRSSEIYLRRRLQQQQGKGTFKNRRRSCNLEILDESVTQEESPESKANEKGEESPDSPENSSPKPRIFRSLSAGSDLDKLKLLADQTDEINWLIKLSLTKPCVEQTRSPSINRKLNCESPITASIQSINNLAEGVEDLRDKLSSQVGIFFPMTAKEQKLEKIVADAKALPKMNKKLSRSHSWQGFGNREMKRHLRQQEFWDSNRYEQVNSADLNLPPPPPTPPQLSSPLIPGRSRSGRNTLNSSINRRYRPLSQSPKRKRRPSAEQTQIPEKRTNKLKETEEAKESSDSDSDEDGLSYECVVTCSVRPNEGFLKEQDQLSNLPENKNDLSPAQIKHLKSIISDINNTVDKQDNVRQVSPEPTEQELQHLMAFMDQELGTQQHSDDEVSKRNKSIAVAEAQNLYRQKYLSIIQEEEESDNGNHTPGSSRPGSRPISGYGSMKQDGLKQAFKEFKENGDNSLAEHRDTPEPAPTEASKDILQNKEKRRSKNLSEILEHVPPPTDPVPPDVAIPPADPIKMSPSHDLAYMGSARYVPGSPEVSKMRITSSSIYPKTAMLTARPLTRVVASSSPEKSPNVSYVTKAHSESPVRTTIPNRIPFEDVRRTFWSYEDDMMPDLVMDTKPRPK